METQNGSATTTNSGSRAQDFREGLEQRLDDVKGYAGDVDGFIRETARERPILMVLCAAGLGFLVGRLASRI